MGLFRGLEDQEGFETTRRRGRFGGRIGRNIPRSLRRSLHREIGRYCVSATLDHAGRLRCGQSLPFGLAFSSNRTWRRRTRRL